MVRIVGQRKSASELLRRADHRRRPLAVLDAIVTYTAESAKGEALRSMQNRITWVLRETGHVLRIVHEHSSAPVGFEDSKAILTRAPAT